MSRTVNDGAKPNNSTKKCSYIMTTKEQVREDIDAWCRLVQSAYGLGHTMGQCVALGGYELVYLTFAFLVTVSFLLQALEIKIPFLGLINFLIMMAVGFFASHMVKVGERKNEDWEAKRVEKLRASLYEMQKLNEAEDKEEQDAIHNN